MRKVILNADDFGISLKTDAGILHCAKLGIVSSISSLINNSTARNELAKIKNFGLSVGLHLNVTGQGEFIAGSSLFGIRGKAYQAMKTHNKLSEKEIAVIIREFEKQLEKFIDIYKRPPSHINFHHPLYNMPGFGRAYASFVEKTGISTRWFRELSNIRIKHPDFTEHGFYEESSLSVSALQKLLKKVPEGITELVLHPGFYDSSLKSSYKMERQKQTEILTDPTILNYIKDSEIKICTFDNLK